MLDKIITITHLLDYQHIQCSCVKTSVDVMYMCMWICNKLHRYMV